MCRIILCKPQREEDKLIDHEEARRRQTHPDITNMISPVLTHILLISGVSTSDDTDILGMI